MHAMIAISVLVEGGAVLTAICFAFFHELGNAGIAMAQAIAFGAAAVIVSLVVTGMLESRGVPPRQVWCWATENGPNQRRRWWWSGDGKREGRFFASLDIGALSGLVFALIAKGYLLVLSQFSTFPEICRKAREQMETVLNLWISYAVTAIVFAPFAEEYLFRDSCFALWIGSGKLACDLRSAAFFAIYHPPLSWLPVF